MSNSIVAVSVPKWGIEMVEGTINGWHAKVGDSVSKGAELIDIETDKIVNVLEAPADGVLRRIVGEEGETLGVGQLLGIICDASVSEADIDAFIAAYKEPVATDDSKAETEAAPVAAASPSKPAAAGKTGGRVSPVVKRRAKELGVDVSTVVGTGSNGRITAEDVELAAANVGEATTDTVATDDATQYSVSKLNNTQKTTGKRLVESKQSVPHFYLSTTIELDALLAKRAQLNSEQAQNVSINDLIVWCTARALMAVPEVNAQLLNDEVHQYQHADICIAVATDRGLLTPILRVADQLSPIEIAEQAGVLIDKAKNGGLQREDIDGGSFTVSNLGMFGIDSFDAIVNPPQVAILALGKGKKQMVVREDDSTHVVTCMNANLSCDHRVVDGAVGGRFLAALKQEIESIQ